MARHRDIDKAHAEFEGHGFHFEYHLESLINPNEKSTRRNKKKCHYYNDGICDYAHTSCAGIDCGSYYE